MIGATAAAVAAGMIAGARGKAGFIAWMTARGGVTHLMSGRPLAVMFAE